MRIGTVEIPGKLVLAPMAGVTDLAFRTICRELGASLTVTEMVSAKALCYQDKKTLPLLEIGEGEHPCAVQLFGSDPVSVEEGAAIALEKAQHPLGLGHVGEDVGDGRLLPVRQRDIQMIGLIRIAQIPAREKSAAQIRAPAAILFDDFFRQLSGKIKPFSVFEQTNLNQDAFRFLRFGNFKTV